MNRWQFNFSRGLSSPTNSEKWSSIQQSLSKDPATHLFHKGKAKWKSPLRNFNWFSCVSLWCMDFKWLAAKRRGYIALVYRVTWGKMETVGYKAGGLSYERKIRPLVGSLWGDKYRFHLHWFLAGWQHRASRGSLMSTRSQGREGATLARWVLIPLTETHPNRNGNGDDERSLLWLFNFLSLYPKTSLLLYP